MTYGLNAYGFDRPIASQIISEVKDTFRETFGQNINVQDNSYLDKQITILADREASIWELLEDVYYTQTLAGAEGKYLDDILSQRGIFRQGKTKGSGNIQMTLNTTAPYTLTFAEGELFALDSTYTNTSEFKVAGSIFAQKIVNTNVPIGSYTFTILNPNTATTVSLTLSLSSNTINSAALNTFYQNIKDFIVDNTLASNEELIQIDTIGGVLYIGYNTSLVMVGLNTVVDFKTTPIVGERTIQFEVEAITAGLNPVYAGTVTSVSPIPAGFISATNLQDFFSGSDVESDAEYRARAGSTSIAGQTATRSAIISGLLDGVDGVKNVKLFPNPTNITSPEGVPPYNLMVVVYGGSTEDISEKLYDLIGCPTNTYGTVAYTVVTEDNSTEVIYHSKATERKLSVRVVYKTVNNKQLTDSEKLAIKTNILELADTFNINSTVFNVQLMSAVASAVNLSRFNLLVVETKNEADPDTSYTDGDITTATTEICVIPEDNISFLQQI